MGPCACVGIAGILVGMTVMTVHVFQQACSMVAEGKASSTELFDSLLLASESPLKASKVTRFGDRPCRELD